MILRRIKQETCEVCDAPTSCDEVETDSSGKIREHAYGAERWETRKFACGRGIRWSPGLSKQESWITCPKDPAVVRRAAARAALIAIACLAIERVEQDPLEIDDKDRKHMIDTIRQIWWRN